MTIKKTSVEWADEFKVLVIDPDGWDRANFKELWNNELISEEEFRKRLNVSTAIQMGE